MFSPIDQLSYHSDNCCNEHCQSTWSSFSQMLPKPLSYSAKAYALLSSARPRGPFHLPCSCSSSQGLSCSQPQPKCSGATRCRAVKAEMPNLERICGDTSSNSLAQPRKERAIS